MVLKSKILPCCDNLLTLIPLNCFIETFKPIVQNLNTAISGLLFGEKYLCEDSVDQDQTVHSVQSDPNLHCPQNFSESHSAAKGSHGIASHSSASDLTLRLL